MSQIDIFAGYPNYPYYAGTETSAEAADGIVAHRSALLMKVYSAIKKKPQTCWELEQLTGLAHQTASARIRELALQNHVRPSGLVRPTGSGRKAIVWEVCDG